MEIQHKRFLFTDNSTISNVYIDGAFECYFLEDTDRGLDSSMTLDELLELKVKGKTAIPYGRYKVVITKSERFSKLAGKDVYLPLLLKVPAFDGARYHPGNKPEDTEGCPLPGTEYGKDQVINSRTAFIKFNDKINAALKKGEDVYVTITKE